MTVKLAHVISFVDDIEGAVAFYRDVLGLTPRSLSPQWVEFDTGTTRLALHAADAHRPSGTTTFSFATPDVADLHRTLVARGVKITREPEVLHGQQIAEFAGPGGNSVGLSGPATPAAASAPGSHAGGVHPKFTKLAQEAKTRIQEISADELSQLRERGPVLVIDVREESEWRDGRIAGAVHIPRGVLEAKVEEAVPDPESRVVLYCGGGGRSALAAESLQKLGYGHVASLIGGFRGWQAAGRPTEK